MAIKLKITNGDYSSEVEAGKTATIKCNGKKLAQDIVIECVAVEEVTLISFTIDGKTYYSPEDWTWEQWVADTKYNTGGFIIFDSVYIGTDTKVIVVYCEDYARVGKDIIEGHTYQLTGRGVMAPSAPDDSRPK